MPGGIKTGRAVIPPPLHTAGPAGHPVFAGAMQAQQRTARAGLGVGQPLYMKAGVVAGTVGVVAGTIAMVQVVVEDHTFRAWRRDGLLVEEIHKLMGPSRYGR